MVDAFGQQFEIENYEHFRKIQLIELEILKEIDRICRKHKIKYSLSGGTLLGAVRHGGFIPWDDDIDIEMTRDNYERFAEIAQKELPNNLFYQDYNTDPFYPNIFAKVRMNDTKYVLLEQKNHKMHQGIFVDIFPVDKVQSGKEQDWLDKIFRYESILIMLQNFRFNGESCWYKCLIKKIMSIVFRTKWLKTFIKKQQIKYNALDNNFKYCITPFHAFNNVNIYPIGTFDSYINIIFEGYEFECVDNYCAKLEIDYGDYMQLPPLDSRIQHHFSTEVSFGSYDWSTQIDEWPE